MIKIFRDSREDHPWLHREICEESLQPGRRACGRTDRGREHGRCLEVMLNMKHQYNHLSSTGPIVVEMSQLVGQLLEVLGRKSGGILHTFTSTRLESERLAYLDHVVTGGVDGALSHGLRDEEEVVPLGECHLRTIVVKIKELKIYIMINKMAMNCISHHIVHDSTGGRVDMVAAGLLDKLGVDPLVNNDEGKLQIVLKAAILQGFLDGIHLMVDNVGDLSIAHTIPRKQISERKKTISVPHLYKMIFSGSLALSCWYFLSAVTMAGQRLS